MTTKRLISGLAMGLLATLLIGLPVLGVGETYKATLSGANEVTPVMTTATGEAVFTFNGDGTLSYRLTVSNITNVTAAHIHLAPVGVNGPVVIGLFGGPAKTGVFTGILGEGVLTAQGLGGPLFGMTLDRLIAEMNAGNAYVQVHTMANPGGEIRGQIALQMGP